MNDKKFIRLISKPKGDWDPEKETGEKVIKKISLGSKKK